MSCIGLESLVHVVERETVSALGLRSDAIARDCDFEIAHAGALSAERLRRILKEHVEEGAPIREWIAAEMPNLAKPEEANRRPGSL
jgi:hypothetical protein